MKKVYILNRILLFTGLIFSLYSCEDEHFSRYEDPPWLGGSIIETLEDRGNYSILIELMKKAGYEEPINKGLFTIFAANDSAFNAYFNSRGIQSIEDLSETEAFQLFTINVMNTPRSKKQLIYDYLQHHGGWQDANSEIGALLWRVNTRSQSNDYLEEVKYFDSFLGETIKVRGQEKKVPMLSTEFFTEYSGATDGSDYNFFFPETEWRGLHWYNAGVVEAEVKTSNGYIYFIDRVVPEIPNINEYLATNQDKFGVYYDLIQRFAEYTFASYDDDPDRTRLYNKSYRILSNIASEVGPSANSPYDRRNSFSAYIPKDDVLQEYIDNTFLQHFENLDSVPEISLIILAQSCITNQFGIASKIRRSFVNFYGDPIPLDIDIDCDEAILLSNGPLYVLNKYYPPKAFSSTISPVFFNKDYTTFLYGINSSRMLASVTSSDLNVTIFAPTNESLLEGGIRYYEQRKQLEELLDDGTWNAMDFLTIKSFVSDHFITDNPANKQFDFSGEGFVKMSSNNYIYYNNNKIQGGGNQENGTVAAILDSKEGDNGVFYSIDKAILAPKNDPARFIARDEDLSEFYQLLFDAGIADSVIDNETEIEYPRISLLAEKDYWTVFAPTNDAIIQARINGEIPDSISELQNFVRYHFLRDEVIFDDGEISGEFETAKIDSAGADRTYFAPVEIVNARKNLQVIDKTGTSISVNNSKANNIVLQGVLHKIDKVFLEE
jgi:uncharacterized surface protein with fasciclin (FAS1) repeats